MRRFSLGLIILLISQAAWAGLFELSATGSYRKQHYDSTHNESMESVTGSLAYYFWEMTAFEMSYTVGNAEQVQPEYTAYQSFKAYGANLLLTMANRDSAFKPYLKVGAAYIIKDLRYDIPNFEPIRIHKEGTAPTAGLGFKLMLTKQFGIKAGVEASSSPMNEDPVTYDFSASGGISLLF